MISKKQSRGSTCHIEREKHKPECFVSYVILSWSSFLFSPENEPARSLAHTPQGQREAAPPPPVDALG